MKVTEVAPEGTVTEDGDFNSRSVLERAIATPEAGAAPLRETTHLALVRADSESGVHVSPLSPIKVTVTDSDEPFRVAVIVADWADVAASAQPCAVKIIKPSLQQLGIWAEIIISQILR